MHDTLSGQAHPSAAVTVVQQVQRPLDRRQLWHTRCRRMQRLPGQLWVRERCRWCSHARVAAAQTLVACQPPRMKSSAMSNEEALHMLPLGCRCHVNQGDSCCKLKVTQAFTCRVAHPAAWPIEPHRGWHCLQAHMALMRLLTMRPPDVTGANGGEILLLPCPCSIRLPQQQHVAAGAAWPGRRSESLSDARASRPATSLAPARPGALL